MIKFTSLKYHASLAQVYHRGYRGTLEILMYIAIITSSDLLPLLHLIYETHRR